MQTEPKEHILLLGDSIIDNKRYVPDGQPCVREQLEAAIATENLPWQVTQAARDGAILSNVYNDQLYDSPADATIIVISAGGNDGLGMWRRLARQPWDTLTTFQDNFRKAYEYMLDGIQKTFPDRPIVLCTIYQAQMGELGWVMDTVASIGVRVLNRIIRDVAAKAKLPLLDLWYIFSRREDYANAIEPGVPGGHKIVRNFMALLKSGGHRTGQHVICTDASYEPAFETTLAQVTHFKAAREVFASGVV